MVSNHGKLTTQKTLFIIKRAFAPLKNSEFKLGVIKIQEYLCIMEWFKGCLLSKGYIHFTLVKFIFNVYCIHTKYWMGYIDWVVMFTWFILNLN